MKRPTPEEGNTVAAKSGPTLRASWLGARLRALRDEHGFTSKQIAEFLNKHFNTIGRFESGEFPIPSDDLVQLFDLYGINDLRERGELLQLREDVAQRGWWAGYAPALNNNFADYVWLEDRAERMRVLDINNVPGLLQTPSYASSLISIGPESGDPKQIPKLVESRLIRSRILTQHKAPDFQFLVYEAALRQRVGGTVVMREQLTRVLELSELPNVELRVLPLENWSHTAASVGGGFTLFDMPAPFPNVACIEGPAGAIFRESPDLEGLTRSYDAIWVDADNADASKARIAQLAKDIQ